MHNVSVDWRNSFFNNLCRVYKSTRYQFHQSFSLRRWNLLFRCSACFFVDDLFHWVKSRTDFASHKEFSSLDKYSQIYVSSKSLTPRSNDEMRWSFSCVLAYKERIKIVLWHCFVTRWNRCEKSSHVVSSQRRHESYVCSF